MSNIKLTVTPEDVGMRVDKFLSIHLPEFSRRHLQLLIKEGSLTIDDVIVTETDYKLRLGNTCVFTFKQITLAPFKIKPKEMQLDIVFEDEQLLVVNKPAGLTVHPGAGNHDDTLINGLVAYCGTNLPEYGKSRRLGLVHRLDRDTTGLLLVAKTETALYKLSKALARREIKRHYLALVYGKIATRCGRIETFIARCPHDRTRMAVNHDDGKLAITNYSLQKHLGDNLSLIECQLETGRTHQIRVHMAHLQHPIVGDKAYGRHLNFNLSSFSETMQEALRQFPRQALHAYKLEFAHPVSEQIITLQISLAKDISDLLELLSLKQS